MDPVTGLSLARIALGIGALTTPATTARAFGLDPENNPHLGYFSRMFGAREIALGAITLAAKGPARRSLVLVGMAVDGADAATGALELAAKRVPRPAGAMLSAAALGAVAAGAVTAARG